MSLPIPLTVVLESSIGGQSITREVDDLRFRWTVPGGFGACTIDLARPIATQPAELGYFNDLTVYDARNGSVVYAGRVEDLGRAAGQDGQVWQISALGPSSHARDLTKVLLYVDRSMERWTPRSGHPKAVRRVDTDDADNQVIRIEAPTGTSWAQNQFGVMGYPYLRYAGLKLGAFNATGKCGTNTANWRWQQISRSPAGAGTIVRTVDFTTTPIAGSQRVASVSFPAGDDFLEFRLIQINATAQGPSDATWCTFGDIYVMQLLLDQSGNELYENGTPAFDYQDGTVTASDVVRDLLGRMLPKFDGPNASITTTTYNIDQLAYPDGATAAKVLDDLMAIHPTTYWAAWEKNVNGRYRFEYKLWDTAVRYEASIGDGINAPGSAGDVWNGVLVRGRPPEGGVRTVRRTSTVPLLDAAGLTRETAIDLGDEVWSTNNVTQVGNTFLAEHQYPPNEGTLTISRPIIDVQTGRTVQPWELRPGLIRVRGVSPAGPDFYNPAGGRNGYTIFKMVSCDYQASTNTATIELDSRPRTAKQMLAEAARMPRNRRR